jgi:hypothetical protein
MVISLPCLPCPLLTGRSRTLREASYAKRLEEKCSSQRLKCATLVWLINNLAHPGIRVFPHGEIHLGGGLTRIGVENICQLFHWLK